MTPRGLPPIHDLARLWRRSEPATIEACVDFLRIKPPGWNLLWFRECAPRIVAGELGPSSLREAVRVNVPNEARRSVQTAIDLFLEFIKKHRWKGEFGPPQDLILDHSKVRLRPIGRYKSSFLQKDFLLALQPRSEDIPNLEQFRIWHSALHHVFCAKRTDMQVMIVDLAKNNISGKREVQELTNSRLPLLDPRELNDRLALTVSCFRKADEIVPKSPPSKPRSPGQKGFPF